MSDKELEKYKKTVEILNKIFNDIVVGNQAAWIEWKNGKGAEAAMQWIENGLFGPGHIPSPDDPYYDNAQFYYSANKSDPFPKCVCGNPSRILWMGKGYCCEEHQKMHSEKLESDADEATEQIIRNITNTTSDKEGKV